MDGDGNNNDSNNDADDDDNNNDADDNNKDNAQRKIVTIIHSRSYLLSDTEQTPLSVQAREMLHSDLCDLPLHIDAGYQKDSLWDLDLEREKMKENTTKMHLSRNNTQTYFSGRYNERFETR